MFSPYDNTNPLVPAPRAVAPVAAVGVAAPVSLPVAAAPVPVPARVFVDAATDTIGFGNMLRAPIAPSVRVRRPPLVDTGSQYEAPEFTVPRIQNRVRRVADPSVPFVPLQTKAPQDSIATMLDSEVDNSLEEHMRSLERASIAMEKRVDFDFIGNPMFMEQLDGDVALAAAKRVYKKVSEEFEPTDTSDDVLSESSTSNVFKTPRVKDSYSPVTRVRMDERNRRDRERRRRHNQNVGGGKHII